MTSLGAAALSRAGTARDAGGSLRPTGGPAQGYRENIAAPRQSKFQEETVSVKTSSLRTVTVTARDRLQLEIPEF
jgi:hypothetical protein